MEKGCGTAGDLAKVTGLTTGAITGTIRRLKKAGISRLAEAGTHEALLAKRGQYAELHGMQAAAYC